MAALIALLLSALAVQPADGAPARSVAVSQEAVEAALSQAGDHRPALESFLARADACNDAQKQLAARWLIANMPGHGFAEYALVDASGARHAFNPMDHPDLSAAEAALKAIQDAHPGADFKVVTFTPDLAVVDVEWLWKDLELAFATWRTRPWCRNVDFPTFVERILPYRGSNEPLQPWREECQARLAPVLAALPPDATLAQVAAAATGAAHGWVGFSDRYYLHPTDQGWADMRASRLGRCEDITNAISFAMRAAGAVGSGDWTPWWADRDNNHAWEVTLDEHGRGHAGLSNRAAKVYRRSFGARPESLASRRQKEEEIPPVFRSRAMEDVTEQYVPVSTVTVALAPPAPGAPVPGAGHAYACVFNGGEWRPIAWAPVQQGEAAFERLGRNVLYLPAWYLDGAARPAGAPRLLHPDGRVELLEADGPAVDVELSALRPETPDADTRVARPRLHVKAGAEPELMVWRNGAWQSLGTRRVPEEGSVTFTGVPGGALLWLVTPDTREVARPFTLGGTRQVFW